MKTPIPQESQRRAEDNVTFLRGGDQITLAIMVGFFAACVAVSTAWSMWRSGGWVHIDQRPANSYAFLVDVNEADWIELAALPTIGTEMAHRIVAHRENSGRYSSLQSLLEVEGIGPKTVEKIQPFLANLDGLKQSVIITK
ncbi:MAG: helix-hairpin-helix domain-containing protein [Pirellulaceae bacterium]|nr:helix-hairpin-helix domain-containing protein [Pirellulaceae bacterium]